MTYNIVMDFPWACRCGHENLIDLGRLGKRPITGMVSALGFVCGKCHEWQTVFHTTRSLDEAINQLENIPIDHPKFQFLFAKVLRKAEGVNQRGTHG